MEQIELDEKALKAAERALSVRCHPELGGTYNLPAAIRAYLAAAPVEPVKDRQNDLRRLLSALGMNTDARSQSPASVFDECLAEIRRIRAWLLAPLSRPRGRPHMDDMQAKKIPERIGLVQRGDQFRLWNWHEDEGTPATAEYVLATALEALQTERDGLAARIVELEAALEPFAQRYEVCKKYNWEYPDISLEQCHDAARALKEKADG